MTHRFDKDEEGSVVPLDEATRIRALQPKADLQILSPAGDLPRDERADDFKVIVSSWLTRQSLSAGADPLNDRAMR